MYGVRLPARERGRPLASLQNSSACGNKERFGVHLVKREVIDGFSKSTKTRESQILKGGIKR